MKRPIIITLLVLALLLVMAGIGAVVFFAVRGSGFAFIDMPNYSATAEESKTLKVDIKEPVVLTVEDDAGDVTVIGGDVKAVEVKIVKTGNAPTQSRAEEDLKNIKYEIKQEGNQISLLYKLDGIQNIQTTHIDNVDFIVTVPTEATVNVDNGFGTAEVTDIQGDVEISNDFGNITAQNIEGAFSVDTSSGEIEVINVDAGDQNVKIDADFGDIKLEKINGKDITITSNSGTLELVNVRATGSFDAKSDFGDVTFENGSAASVTLETSSGHVTLTKVNISGDLLITNDFGDLELNQTMADSYNLTSNSGSITIDGAKNEVTAHTDFGNIVVKNAKNAILDLTSNSGAIEFSGSLGDGPHTLQSDFGDINLALPTDTKLTVDLKTDFGNIESDLPITVTLTGNSDSDKSQIVGSINGGGVQLNVQTNSGGITINAIK